MTEGFAPSRPRKRSLAQLLSELQHHERQAVELREENARGRAEADRLRKQLNGAYAATAGKMMDVAMSAGVQALQDEAQHQRRLLIEQAMLCDELRATESRLDWHERLTFDGAPPAIGGTAKACSTDASGLGSTSGRFGSWYDLTRSVKFEL